MNGSSWLYVKVTYWEYKLRRQRANGRILPKSGSVRSISQMEA
jgi:hypothetical protein